MFPPGRASSRPIAGGLAGELDGPAMGDELDGSALGDGLAEPALGPRLLTLEGVVYFKLV